MSQNTVSDIDVLWDGDGEINCNYNVSKEADGTTKINWIKDFNILTELEKRPHEPDIILVKKTLLIGRFYTPYVLQLWWSPLKTGRFNYKVKLSVTSTKDNPHEDEKYQESHSKKKHRDGLTTGGICAIWSRVNYGEKLLLDRTSGEHEGWTLNFPCSKQHPSCKYWIDFQLWFKLTDHHAEKNALQQLSALYVNQTHCDINFCLENGQRVGGHKCILSTRSPVFAAMFQHEMQEAKTGQVVITDIEPDAFKELLYFIYSSKLRTPLTEAKAKLLFVAADKYDIEDLKTICLCFLLPFIRVDNVIYLMVWAHNYSVGKLKKAALKFVAANFVKVCLTEEWAPFVRDYPDLHVLVTREMMKKKTDGDIFNK